MRQVVEDAVGAAVAEVAGHLDEHHAGQLSSALLVRDVGFDVDGVQVSNEAELCEALHGWVAALDVPEFGESGYLSALGVDRQRLAEVFSERVVAGIWRNARAGGPLSPLAEWGWRDDTTARLARIEEKVDAAANVTGPAGGWLPGGTPDFTGRREVLAELGQRIRLHDPAGIVVAIHAVDGMAGVGKTELALRAAHQHKHRYPDGQYFINLHGYTPGVEPMSPVAVLEELLRQAGVPGQQIPTDLPGRQARWQRLMAGRQALVLLDNALDTDQVRPVLPNSAGCLVLVTSRIRLADLPGARALPLDVLPPAEAVQLFTRLAGSGENLDPQVTARVVEIVGRLPVAVRAVAGQVADDYTAAELADDLAEGSARAGLVDTAGVLGPGVYAAFETSLQRLHQTSRRTFRVLGVHPGPVIGVPQFAALAGLPTAQARRVLRGLATRNLITPVSGLVGHRRYQLHDLLRGYARQQAEAHLPAAERSAAIARLTTWYDTAIAVVERMLDTIDAGATGSEVEGLSLEGPGEARAWLAAEQDNLLAFAEQATGQDAAQVCFQFAQRLYQLDRYVIAQALYRSAADIYHQIGDRAREADALRGLGHVALATGDYPGADEQYRAALAIIQQTGDRAGEGDALRGLGHLARATGDYPGADEQYRAALTIFQQTGDRRREADALRGLGHVARATGDYPGADEQFRGALTIFQQIGDQGGEAGALLGLGEVAMLEGRCDETRQRWQTALAICVEIGSPLAESVQERLEEVGQG
jgi:tetratricopeptide (TPR) repeat protein